MHPQFIQVETNSFGVSGVGLEKLFQRKRLQAMKKFKTVKVWSVVYKHANHGKMGSRGFTMLCYYKRPTLYPFNTMAVEVEICIPIKSERKP